MSKKNPEPRIPTSSSDHKERPKASRVGHEGQELIFFRRSTGLTTAFAEPTNPLLFLSKFGPGGRLVGVYLGCGEAGSRISCIVNS